MGQCVASCFGTIVVNVTFGLGPLLRGLGLRGFIGDGFIARVIVGVRGYNVIVTTGSIEPNYPVQTMTYSSYRGTYVVIGPVVVFVTGAFVLFV